MGRATTQRFSALQELGDTTRLMVFLAILGMRKNVSQIVSELGLAQPQVSYHLRKLKQAGLAVEEKDGRWVWYQADWESPDRNIRDFIGLMARWAEDVGAAVQPPVTAGPPGPAARPHAGAPSRPAVVGKGEGRPVVRRPSKADDEMDDFLL